MALLGIGLKNPDLAAAAGCDADVGVTPPLEVFSD
jgi:hypothetical protein